MLLFAEAQFRLNQRQGDNCTLREHLIAAWRMTGVEPAELAEAPSLPPLAAHVWSYFAELSRFRGSNGFGANPITPTGIKDWCWLAGMKLDPWEIRAIALLDEAYLRKEDD
ncbi:MAG: hypothetical protein B7Z31_00010 [Rhodobacterales bacterium 12-65-15]|nr:MAG: hypothetical protein B7Z31_00010 [Rhodobacterales bacterium 12-65-15]